MLIKAYSARDAADAHFVRGLLLAENIHAVIMGESLAAIAGAIPFDSASPSVWVNQEDADRAQAIVSALGRRHRHSPLASPADNTWRCPNCGEMLEAQFTDCWNCQTPRPEQSEGAPPAPQPPPSTVFEQDLPCLNCGYNLRGLPPLHRCPECGQSILYAALETLCRADPGESAGINGPLRVLLETPAATLGYPADALLLICHACLRIAARSQLPPALNPRQLCLAIRDHAVEFLGGIDEARAVFRAWRLLSSEDLGRIAAGLVAANILPWPTNLDPARFRGLFALDELFISSAPR